MTIKPSPPSSNARAPRKRLRRPGPRGVVKADARRMSPMNRTRASHVTSRAVRTAVGIAALIAALALPASAAAVEEDITPPQVDALSVSPSEVDVTSSAKTVTVKATITDPPAEGGVSSGVAGASISYTAPGGGGSFVGGSF